MALQLAMRAFVVSSLAIAGVAQERIEAAALPPVIARVCAECHAGNEPEGKFALEPLFAAGAHIDDTRAHSLRTALQRVRSQTMPPPDEGKQPTAEERAAIAAAIAARIPTEPGDRIATSRRLSRVEWQNTVRDLCGIEVDASELLPEDPRVRGFDNFGDGAGETAASFEAHLLAANRVAKAMRASEPRHAAFDERVPFADELAAFASCAFRRDVTASELAPRMDLYLDALSRGACEAEAREAAVVTVLASPAFLLRIETGRSEEPWLLTAHEVATRVAYAFSATMPDEALRNDAGNGAIFDASVMRAHARRLVAKDGGRALATRFFAQWLRLEDVLAANADSRRYPQIWKQSLRPAFYEEAVLLCAEIAREDASLLWLIDCDHTWADATLAEHYGVPKPEAKGYARIALQDRRRGGVLGMGAMLMVSSHALRTSPVLRGKWILDQLLDAAPPPPPANVAALPKDDVPAQGKSMRAQLEAHRQKRACASCHAQIDPLGFALENYDVVGKWREDLHGEPLDTRATLPDGAEIDGPIALKDALLERKGEFALAVARKFFVFAVGRDAVAQDEPELARIAAACEADGFRMWALVDALLGSPLFTMRDPGAMR